MRMLRSSTLGRLTPHEDLGIDTQGRHKYRCTVTGEERGITKAQREKILNSRVNKKEEDLKIEPTFTTMKDQDVTVLKEYIANEDSPGE